MKTAEVEVSADRLIAEWLLAEARWHAEDLRDLGRDWRRMFSWEIA